MRTEQEIRKEIERLENQKKKIDDKNILEQIENYLYILYWTLKESYKNGNEIHIF